MSMNPDGQRVLGALPVGFSGPGPLDVTPMYYAPTPVLPMLLPLEFRTDLAEAGWQQAPYECILESVRAMTVVTNQRIIFVGTSRSETSEEGVFIVPRGSVGSSIGAVALQGAQRGFHEFRSFLDPARGWDRHARRDLGDHESGHFCARERGHS